MIRIRKLAFILGLLLFAPRAEATVLEFDFSGVSVNPLTGFGTPNPLGYTATASFTLDSSDFTPGSPFIYTQGVSKTGITVTDIYTSALTSFSAGLATPLGNRQFSLSDVQTGCFSPVPGSVDCWTMIFETLPSGQLVFINTQDGFTNSGNPLGFVNIYGGGLTFHGGAVRVDYSGTWTKNAGQNGGVAAPLSDVGTGLPSLLLVGGPIFWGRRRQSMNPLNRHSISPA
jgi:hypothetical protein